MTAPPLDPSHEAFDRAMREFKSGLDDDSLYSEILQTTSIEQVYDATDKLQLEQGKSGALRNLSRITPYLNRLNEYAASIEVFIQVKPDILALLWGPIKLLLQWASALMTSFDAIVSTTAEIGALLPEFQQVARLFSNNAHIKNALPLFFKDILDFYQVALRFFKLPRWKLFFESLWPRQREKIKVVMKDIDDHTRLMRNEVRLEHIQQEHEARIRAFRHFEETAYHRIKTDISPKYFDEELDRVRAQVCPGTGKWLTKDPTFRKWLDESDKATRILWLQGIPGAGKTFLSSTVADEARIHGRTALAFLSYKMSSKTSPLSILHSLIFQLTSDDETLQTLLCESAPESLKRDLSSTVGVLKTVLNYVGTSYIIVDGLDEINELDRCRLLRELLVISNAYDKVRILISSRPEADLKSILQNEASVIRIDQRNAGSIQVFVNCWMQDWFVERGFLPETQAEMKGHLAPLASNAKGMFLYVKVVLSYLRDLNDLAEIRNEIEALPKNLDDAYARVLSRVNSLSPCSSKDMARKILGWIACTPVSLTIQEIQQALTINPKRKEVPSKVLVGLDLVKLCGPIVEIVDEYVQFVHFTVKEYISSDQNVGFIDIMESTANLAMCCVTYLCQDHHDPLLEPSQIYDNLLSGAYALHDFASTTWFQLVENCVSSSKELGPPPELIHLLETLWENRENDRFQGEKDESHQPRLKSLQDDQPELYRFLCQVSKFRRLCSTSEHRMTQGSPWIDLDPLTTSDLSVLIHVSLDELLSVKDAQGRLQHETTVRAWHGDRPFKCRFLHCSFRRQGFGLKSKRRSHEKHHDKPWKCSFPGCEYAEGGFLSRKMRDVHLERFHQKTKTETANLDKPDADDIQPLLFDLVRADEVDAVRELLPIIKELGENVSAEIWKMAASSGSPEMLELAIDDENIDIRYWLLKSSVKGRNVDCFSLLLSRMGTVMIEESILEDIFVSNCDELLDAFESFLDAHLDLLMSSVRQHTLGRIDTYSWFARGVRTTAGIPQREQILLKFFERKGFIKGNESWIFGALLLDVTSTTCSVGFANYLIDHGADVNWRRKQTKTNVYPTPLQYAARNCSEEGAEMMKLLLLRGADPEAHRKNRKIGDEKGAKGIEKWLGVTWDELIAQTKKERERGGSDIISDGGDTAE